MADWWERTKQYWYLPVLNGGITGEIRPIRMDDESYRDFKKENHMIYDSFETAEYWLGIFERKSLWQHLMESM